MSELYKVFYNRKTGKELAAYTIRGTFDGEEEATRELLAYDTGADLEDIATRTEERRRRRPEPEERKN